MPNKNKYTIIELQQAVKNCLNWADVCRKVGVKPMTGSQSHLKKKAISSGFDYSHFLGKGSNKGKKFKRKDALEYCFKGSKETSHRLKNRLIRDGYKEEKCELCGTKQWMGEEIVLELDHIDNDHSNNELSNLQVICPNCHALKTRKARKNTNVR